MAVPQTQPIDPARFALALEDLPLDSLHAKAAEIRNSINHLRSSNEQMLPFADEGDEVCKEAMFENLTVINRMNERIALLKAEVEKRGFLWGQDPEDVTAMGENEGASGGLVNGEGGAVNGHAGQARATAAPSGSLTDDELRRQLEAQMAEEEDDGVHL